MEKKTEIVEGTNGQIAVSQVDALLSVIERASLDPTVDIDKMERLLQMHAKITARQSEMDFISAMTECQSMMGAISTDMSNSQTHSRYASYTAIDKVLRPIYTSNGFSLSFNTDPSDNPEVVVVTCKVSHKGGHSEIYRASMPADGKGAKGGDVMTKTHATGAAFSYGSRYLLKMIFNVAIGEDDTDGNMPVEKIAPEQAQKIHDLIKSTNSKEDAFLKYCKVVQVEDIGIIAYPSILKMLERKGKAK